MLNAKNYVSENDKIQGEIREEFSDFLVEEVPKFVPNGSGENIWLFIEKKKISTLDIAMQIARNLKISQKRIGFAGMKDTNAVAKQWFSVTNYPKSKLEELTLYNAAIKKIVPHTKKLRLGQLLGNKFEIIIRTDEKDITSVWDILRELERKGVANYFGWQRFGYKRPNTHLVGKALIKNDLKEAVDTYVGKPYEKESVGAKIAREEYDHGNIKKSLDLMPKNLSYERTMLKSLIKNEKKPDKYRKAIDALPIPLKKMFVGAYQSYLFNAIVSERIQFGINRYSDGDILINNDEKITAKPENVQKEIDSFNLHPTAPLLGSKVPLASDKIGKIEIDVLKKEKVKLEDFECKLMPKLGSYGIRRAIRFKLSDISCESHQKGIKVSFFIPKGCYATAVLREIIAGDVV